MNNISETLLMIRPQAMVCLLLMSITLSAQEISKRNLANLDGFNWHSAWSTASGIIERSKEAASDQHDGIRFTVNFKGKGFTYYSALPFDSKQTFPGKVTKIRFVAKSNGGPTLWDMKFKVKNGNKLEDKKWGHKKISQNWQEFVFEVPPNHPPIVNLLISANNWEHKQTPLTSYLYVSELEVYTDINSVKDPKTLLSVNTATGRSRNLFKEGEKLSMTISAGSWFQEPLGGKLDLTVINPYGKEVDKKSIAIVLDDTYTQKVTHTPKHFGVYTIKTKMTFDNGQLFEQDSQCASIPTAPQYTKEEQKIAPWAINIHGGIEGVSYKSIKQLGFQWIRDYAFQEEWLRRGRGNGDWTGWPWYLKMDHKLQDAGLLLVPCTMKTIEKYLPKNPEPPTGWMDDTIQLMLKFPHYQAFEADNELDLHYPKVIEADNFESYGRYHQAYAKAVKGVRPEALVIEQGQAGIKTNIIKTCIERGHFDKVDVVNSHFYCGTSPSLLTRHNANTGQQGALAGNLLDKMKEFAKTADMDGKDRQAWMTEFGWDTLVMHIVTEHTQAAFTQRGFAMGFYAGYDKMFLYWNRDTKGVPNTFFDGMGIFDPQDEPKPVAAAMAAMIHFLKLPKVRGSFYPGENAYGYIFNDRGRLVGMAFQLDPEKPSSKVLFPTGDIHDMYANPLDERKQQLGIGAIWIDNINPNDPFVKQTDFSLLSKRYVRGAAGDTLTIRYELKNNRKNAYTATISNTIPEGWTLKEKPDPITVKPGETKNVSIQVQIDRKATESEQQIWTTISDGKVAKKVYTDVEVVRAASIGTLTLSGGPGKTKLPFSLTNNSLGKRSYTVVPQLPTGWSASPIKVALEDIDGLAIAKESFEINWNADYDANTPAKLTVQDETATVVYERPIVPDTYTMPVAKNIKLDGNFTDWPKEAVLPSWIVGTMGLPKDLQLRTAYAPEGIYVGIEINPSHAKASSPKMFWVCDVLELCIDTQNDKTKRRAYQATDHQFWLTPLVDQNKVYLGRWKRNNEIAQTQYNIPNKGYAKKTKDGYILEMLIPAKSINGYKASSGSQIGLAMVLTAPAKIGNPIDAYWPLPKHEKIVHKPNLWGTMKLK